MNKNLELIKSLRNLLERNSHQVSEVEMTSGNYDEHGCLMKGEIPTITTGFCEVGAYGEVCYFTIILKSSIFTRKLFDSIAKYPGVQIYGLREFQTNYYPKDNFVYNDFEKQINSEEFMQIQFNFDIINLSPEMIYKKHSEIVSMFKSTGIEAEDQLIRDFTKDTNG